MLGFKQENIMSHKILALITVENKEAIAKYREGAKDALAKHGGAVLSAAPISDTYEEGTNKPSSFALIEFPNKEAAQAWHNDPELQDLHALRRSSGQSTIFDV